MTTDSAIIDQLQRLEAGQQEIRTLLRQLIGRQQQDEAPLPFSPDANRLICLARQDQAASIAECKRLAKLDTRRRAEQRRNAYKKAPQQVGTNA